jgi:hypothetical protein
MPNITNDWKSDNEKFVGKAFDFAYANRLAKMLPIIGEDTTNTGEYDLTGTEGYGEMEEYDGANLNEGTAKRGFRTTVITGEFTKSVKLGRKECRIDKFGSTKRVGQRLGNSAALTVYAHALRMFSHAYDDAYVGGDGVPFASSAHPVAALYEANRKYVPDPDAGIYSNLMSLGLSVESITKMQSAASRFVTPDGAPFLCDYDTLLVSPELEAQAKKICGENGKYRPTQNPDDDTNAANPVSTMQYIVIGGGRDGFSAKQWAVCDKALMKEIVSIIYGERPSVFANALDNPLFQQFTAYADFGLGWGDARQIIFSRGA